MAEHVTAAPWEIPYPGSTGEVKLGATDMQEIAERTTTLLKEHTLIRKAYTGPATLKTGELAEQKKAGETFTLPAATTVDQIIGVFCAVSSCKVTTSGGAVIYGGAVNGVGTVTFTENQHAVFQSNGTNWLIMAGEVKAEQEYAQTSLSPNVNFFPSTIRPAACVLEVFAGGHIQAVLVNVKPLIQAALPTGVPVTVPYVPAGQPLNVTFTGSCVANTILL